MDREKVTFTGTQETMLATLHGKAMESRSPNSLLRDHEADRAMQRIDYDFSRLKMSARDQKSSAVRAKAYDRWVEQYIDAHRDCTKARSSAARSRASSRTTTRTRYQTRYGRLELARIVDAPIQSGTRGFHRGLEPLQQPDACPAVALEDQLTAGKVFGDPPQHRHSVGCAQVRGESFGHDQDWRVPGDLVEQMGIGDRGGDGVETLALRVEASAVQLFRLFFQITPMRRLGRGLRYRFGPSRA